MNRRANIIFKVVTAVVAVATLIVAGYIMLHGMGLVPDLDFGAGAYYYADIPDFDKYDRPGAYESKLPTWLAIILFLAWGALMWFLWKWVDKSGSEKD